MAGTALVRVAASTFAFTEMQRRLTAILAADMVGYSRLMGADEAGTHTAVKRSEAT